MDDDGGAVMEQGTSTIGQREIIEFSTHIRERPVSCRWAAGELSGDAELLARLDHAVLADGWADEPASVARAISMAVACPVVIRVLPPAPTTAELDR